MAKSVQDIIIRPIVTERSMGGMANRQYTFEVRKDADKVEIRNAVEEMFKVKVLSVNTMNLKGKEKRLGVHTGRRPSWKKAIVRLTEDSKPIEFFESLM